MRHVSTIGIVLATVMVASAVFAAARAQAAADKAEGSFQKRTRK